MAKILRIGSLALTLALLASIAYCVLGPHSHMTRIWWIPDWVGEWADRHPYFRNFPPFAALSALLFFVLSFFRPQAANCKLSTFTVLMSAFPRFSILQRALVCALLVSVLGTGLEFLQQLVPERVGHFRYMQILWSVAGAFAGASAAALAVMLMPQPESLRNTD